MNSKSHDLIIIGAGPAGLVAAENASYAGADVLLLEKKEIIGEKPCGGALTLRPLKDKWHGILSLGKPIKCIKIVFPSGDTRYIHYEEPVIVNIDRVKLGKFLAEKAKHAGVLIKTKNRVFRIIRENNVWSVFAKENGETRIYKAKAIIGADGVPSLVVRQTKIRAAFTKAEIGFSLQYTFRASNSISSCDEFYYGHNISPFGYGWIFPHKSHIRVGVGALVKYINSSMQKYLTRFVSTYFSDKVRVPEPYKFEAALTPLSGIKQPSYDKSLLIVGDSAGQVQPISGEGIALAIRAGEIAGKVMGDAIKRKNLSKNFLKLYEQKWIKQFGNDLKWGRRLISYFASRAHRKSDMSFILKDEKLIKLVADILVNYESLSKLLVKSVPRLILRKLF